MGLFQRKPCKGDGQTAIDFLIVFKLL